MSPDAGWDELHLLEEPAVELPRPLCCTLALQFDSILCCSSGSDG